MLRPVAVSGSYESRNRHTCVVPEEAVSAQWLKGGTRGGETRLTTGSGGFGIGKEHNTSLAFLGQLRQSGLGSIICFYLAAEACEINGVANHWSTAGSGFFSIGRVSHGFRDCSDFLLYSLRDLGDLLSCSFRGRLRGRRLLFGRAHRRGRGGFALAESDHDGLGVVRRVAKLYESWISVANKIQGSGDGGKVRKELPGGLDGKKCGRGCDGDGRRRLALTGRSGGLVILGITTRQKARTMAGSRSDKWTKFEGQRALWKDCDGTAM